MEKRRLKVAETYIKLDLEFSEDRNRELEIILRRAVEKTIRDSSYKETFVYKIDFDKGSIKAKVVFFAFLNGMIFYADLKQSVNVIYNDVKWLSEQVINNARQESNLIDNNIIRTERRTGVIGRLKTVLNRIDFLQINLNNIGNNQTQSELNRLHQEVANLIQLLDEVEQQTFVQSLPEGIRSNLPVPEKDNVQHLINLYAIKPDDEEGLNYQQ